MLEHNQRTAGHGYRLLVFAAALLTTLLPGITRGDINPWIASAVYDPARWDTAGPYTTTPWLHPPPYQPGQGWGMLDPSAIRTGRWKKFTNFFGSWGGPRDELMKRGISVAQAYFGQLAANPAGGVDEGGTSWRGDLAVGMFLDLQRIIGWDRTYFTASFDWKHGTDSLTNRYVGNQFPVQLGNGDDDGATRLVHLVLGKQLFDNNAEIVAGRVITGEEFATLRLACISLNQAICGNPIAAAQSISFPTYPSAVWGGHFKLKPGKAWFAQVGSYLVSSDFRNPDDHGVQFGAPAGAGALTLAEFTYITGEGVGPGDLPGRYKLGGYYDSEELTDLQTQKPVDGTWGMYLMGQQMLFSDDPKHVNGLSAWLSLSYAPPNRNLIEFMAAGGLLYQGFVPGRPGDGLAFVAAYGRYSGDLRKGQRARNEAQQHGEVLLEVNYRFAIAPWLWIEPDVQGILRPKGRSDIADAFIIGFAVGFVM